MKILSSFNHHHVVPNLNDLLSSVEDKERTFFFSPLQLVTEVHMTCALYSKYSEETHLNFVWDNVQNWRRALEILTSAIAVMKPGWSSLQNQSFMNWTDLEKRK